VTNGQVVVCDSRRDVSPDPRHCLLGH